MKKILYFQCNTGISGDMTLGALLDLGVDKEIFLDEINKLSIKDEFELKIEKKKVSGIEGTNVDVILKEHHHHEDEHDHHHGRHLADIYKIIDGSKISKNAKSLSKKIFEQIGKAEAKVHGTTIDKIHFHEVGAVDSIVDIVGTAILVDMLSIDKIYSTPIPFGKGFVKCDHGFMPLPAPATIEILRGYEVKFTQIESELTTPTGAGIIKALSSGILETEDYSVNRIGYGLGNKELPIPNMLRAVLIEQKKKKNYMK